MEQRTPLVGVSLIIVKDDTHILMGKRKGSRGAGKLSIPGGHVEIGETLIDAVGRECDEEIGTNIEMHPPYYVSFTEDFYPDAHYITHFYETRYISGEPILMEPEKCEGWFWYPISNLRKENSSNLFKPCRTLFIDQCYYPGR